MSSPTVPWPDAPARINALPNPPKVEHRAIGIAAELTDELLSA